jgi:5-methylcytosine-specific restriction protein B
MNKNDFFDLARDEQERLSFIEKFPPQSLSTMQLEQYVLTGSKETFTYWLEFNNILCGIRGGNASKFHIYHNKNLDYVGD